MTDNPTNNGISLACGDNPTSCRIALQNNFDTTMRSDPCTVVENDKFNRTHENYRMWLPPYKRSTCESSGYVNCSPNAERFGPQQVLLESHLQGRGQVTTGCAMGDVKYLPSKEFEKKTKRKSNQELFAQSTTNPRACGSLVEVDIDHRVNKNPSDWQGSYSPFLRAPAFHPKMPDKEVVTLGTKNKHPDWKKLREQSEPYKH